VKPFTLRLLRPFILAHQNDILKAAHQDRCQLEEIAALARGESVDPSTYYFRTRPRFET